jgi:eukaryotic-like serine/threonine-protein kinase
MVQELLPGPTLEQRMRAAGRRRLAAERVLAIIDQLAGPLDYAHSQGVIHRDIKPSNALYNAAGQLVLTDFGIARNIASPVQATTEPGIVMGTPGYIAPEQAISSVALTPACDIYALGALLFELLTGRLPFEADTAMGVILKHLYDDPPRPSSLRPDLPRALDAVVLRAMHKEPAERYPNAQALAQALRAAWPPIAKPARPAARAVPKSAAPTPARPKAAPAAPKPAANSPSAHKRAAPKPGAPKASDAFPAPAARPAPKPVASKAKPTTVAATAVAAPRPRRAWQVRVGLFTTTVVSALILFGLYPNALSVAWQAVRQLIGF